jgi:hypothetical protein
MINKSYAENSFYIVCKLLLGGRKHLIGRDIWGRIIKEAKVHKEL